MAGTVIVDSGPLVALFDRDDQFHAPALDFIRAFKGELLTTVAVMTEVVHLLDFSVTAQTDFLAWVHDGGATVVNISSEDLNRIAGLM